MKIFVISDTHWNHENIKVFENRPDNYHALIEKNWNRLVAPEDLVIHLGDVIFSRASELKDILGRLNGKKVLALGNHDHKSPNWYMDNGFEFASSYLIYGRIAFSHCPLTPLPKQANFSWEKEVELNIHGHFIEIYPMEKILNYQTEISEHLTTNYTIGIIIKNMRININ